LDLPTEQITWDRAWHTATTYLSIPDRGFNLGWDGGEANDDELDEETLIKRWAKEPPSQFVSDNIFYVGADASPGRERRTGLRECDLQEWYMSETRRHFLSNFRDTLVKVCLPRLSSSDGLYSLLSVAV
jgi:anaphase-promoting complex subunit 2